MKKMVGIVPFLLLIWLHLAYGTFGKMSVFHQSFMALSNFLDSVVQNNLASTLILFLGIPLLSIIGCYYSLFNEKDSSQKIFFGGMALGSIISFGIFLFITLMGLTNQ
ncbi:hypothetical protein NSA39_06670 [Enterococcus gallinarum]|uniref:hypothetical protein n=1 Tax=Enterococcus gallinarum TaxID=1353 RepID=UPI00214B8D46|nr:hypothetical protein [Enterococcus gallinarum]MCR1927546.1 hypothetical protein [Enterococcus gallinarum]